MRAVKARDPSDVGVGHYVKLKDNGTSDINAQYLLKPQRIRLAAGSLLIWDSRTGHQGTGVM